MRGKKICFASERSRMQTMIIIIFRLFIYLKRKNNKIYATKERKKKYRKAHESIDLRYVSTTTNLQFLANSHMWSSFYVIIAEIARTVIEFNIADIVHTTYYHFYQLQDSVDFYSGDFLSLFFLLPINST